jgi:hypothetical protein
MLQVTGATFKTQLFIFTKGEAIRPLHKQTPGMRKQRVSSGISIPLVPSERQYRSGFATISDTENRLLDSGATYKTLKTFQFGLQYVQTCAMAAMVYRNFADISF